MILTTVGVGLLSLLIGLLFFWWLCDKRPGRLKVNGKVVVITGGTQGLGLAVAIECIGRNAKVVLISRKTIDPTSVDGLKQGKVLSLGADVTNPVQLEAAFEKIKSLPDFGRVDFLIASAGLSKSGETEILDINAIKAQLDVNVLGVMNTIRAGLPIIKDHGGAGRIGIVSSVGGQIGIWGMSAYCASKFALRGFADALYMELYGTPISITTIYPPDMRTPGSVFKISLA